MSLPYKSNVKNRFGFIFLGASPHSFTQAAVASSGGALSHPPAFTRRGRAVRLNSPCPALGPRCAAERLPAVSHPATAGRRQGFGSYRFHPWRDNKVRAINRAATMEHQVYDCPLLQTLK